MSADDVFFSESRLNQGNTKIKKSQVMKWVIMRLKGENDAFKSSIKIIKNQPLVSSTSDFGLVGVSAFLEVALDFKF